MVTHTSWSWSWTIDSHPFRSMSINPPIPQILQAWEWVAMKKTENILQGGTPRKIMKQIYPFGAFWCILFNHKNGLRRPKKRKSVKTRQIWGIWKLRPAYSPETPNLGQNRWCFVPCDLEIWWMTLENNRASLLCCFKLCATFHSHWWIQTGVTVRKRPIWVKFDDF